MVRLAIEFEGVACECVTKQSVFGSKKGVRKGRAAVTLSTRCSQFCLLSYIAKIPKSRYRHTWVTLLPGTLGGKPGHT
jgi:hypothetical protein